MKLTDNESDLLQALTGTTKSALSIVPGIAQAIAGWDSYQQSRFNRNVEKVLVHLQNKINDVDTFFKDDWLQTDDGQQFAWKVFDASLDSQLEDKQELFVNALIQGVIKKDLKQLEKLKFIDILRSLSLSALVILSEMDNMFIKQVRGPGRNPDPTSAYPLVNAESIAEKLSKTYEPFLVTSAVKELESQGLFSQTAEWHKSNTGASMAGGGFATELCYTDFTARFAEFIKNPLTNYK